MKAGDDERPGTIRPRRDHDTGPHGGGAAGTVDTLTCANVSHPGGGRMKLALVPSAVALVALAAVSTNTYAQRASIHRLPLERLDVMPPSARVQGEPGALTIQQRPCVAVPGPDVRRRIVDVAVQEWAFFGFSVVDETDPESWVRRRRPTLNGASNGASVDARRRLALERAEEAARVAASIAGYWAVTTEGPWIVGRQNDAWNASGGTTTRWVEPWSAAFISWVMCEAGLGEASRFQRAVAHHVYIDQAIRARDGRAPEAAFTAYDVGEAAIVPGDLLCAARRPGYRTLDERRSQMGSGARSHCDVVVKVDEERALLLAIGGNVRGTVGLKLLPAERRDGEPLRPMDRSGVPGARSTFAHLKLRADPIEASAFDSSPTIAALNCAGGIQDPDLRSASTLLSTEASAGPC